MPIRIHIDVTCACHLNENRRGRAYKVSVDGVGALIDLCPQGKREYLDPLLHLMKKHGRQDQQAEIPPEYTGAIQDAWPNASPAAAALRNKPSNGHGGARPGAGGPPIGNGYLCPVASCQHPLGTESGIQFHMTKNHAKLKYAHCLPLVTLCGLCDPPELLSSEITGPALHVLRHRNQMHSGVHKASKLALVSAVRRAGDPHGTLTAMDAYIADWLNSKSPDTQPAVEDPDARTTDPTGDHAEDHSEGE